MNASVMNSVHRVSQQPEQRGDGTWESWNGLIRHGYAHLYVPRSEEELQEVVAQADQLRVLGNGQSSSDIAAGTDTLVSLEAYNDIVRVDSMAMRIEVQAGMTLKSLMHRIEAKGWSIDCLPDIDTVTVGGAIATGTHGTAGGAKPLHGYVVGMRIIRADGSVDVLDEDSEELPAARCAMGMLGVVSTLTFQCTPLVRLNVEEGPVADSVWLSRYRTWLDVYDFVRVQWLPHTGHAFVSLGKRDDSTQAVTAHPSFPWNPNVSVKRSPWYASYRREVSRFLYKLSARVPRFTVLANRIIYFLFFRHRVRKSGSLYGATVTKKRNSTLELAEWTVATDSFPRLFTRMKRRFADPRNAAYAHIPMDVRFLKADSTWLSNAYGRDTVTVGCVTRNPEYAHLYEAFDLVEDLFLGFDGRPHWAKRFKATHEELSTVYPKWEDFMRLRQERDPDGKFINEYLSRICGL